MEARELGRWLGGGIAVVAALALLTAVPLGPTTTTVKDASGTAVAQQSVPDCLDVDFAAQVSYSVTRPWLDVWGFKRVHDIFVDHGTLSVAARDDCADQVNLVAATVYLNSPVCGSGLCEDAHLEYASGVSEDGSHALVNFDGPQALPGSGIIRGDWCLEFDAGVQDGSTSAIASVTSSDFCLGDV